MLVKYIAITERDIANGLEHAFARLSYNEVSLAAITAQGRAGTQPRTPRLGQVGATPLCPGAMPRGPKSI